MKIPVKSKRGVYYDLTKSPYEYINSYGDLFKFSSSKKLEIFKREHNKRIERLEKELNVINKILGTNHKITRIYIKLLEEILYKDVEK